MSNRAAIPAPSLPAHASTLSACRAAIARAVSTAYLSQPAEYRSFFGVTASVTKSETVFGWRNYLTGARGTLARVPEAETLEAARAILGELRALRTPPVERKRPERRPPAQSVMMRRRKRA